MKQIITHTIAFVKALNVLSNKTFESDVFFQIHRSQESHLRFFIYQHYLGSSLNIEALQRLTDKAEEELSPSEYSFNSYHVKSTVDSIINAALSGQLEQHKLVTINNMTHNAALTLMHLLEGSSPKATMRFSMIVSELEDFIAPPLNLSMINVYKDLSAFVSDDIIPFNSNFSYLKDLLNDTFETRGWT